MGRHRLIEHTADMGIEASAATAEELFVEAARGLAEMLFGPARGQCREEHRVAVQGEEVGELLVNWLSEILYLFEVKGLYPVDFSVVQVGSREMRGTVAGEPFSPEQHPVERVVKAITYHRLRVEHRAGQWRAQFYVDL